jgi:hypothetical protein
MNTIISKTRNAFTLLFLASLTSSFSLTSRAAVYPDPHDHAGSASTADVRYLGNRNDGVLFNVLYSNTTGAKFTVTVLDGDGNRIFQDTYTDKGFNRKFVVLDAEAYGKLTFVVRSFADNSIQRFEIHSSAQVIEDIEVKEIK